MPLRDHFRPPLDDMRHWEGFHATWPVMIVALLRRKLPRPYFAEPRVHSGASAEIDVTTFEPAQDVYEVRVYDEKRHCRLVAAVEIVSPGNKAPGASTCFRRQVRRLASRARLRRHRRCGDDAHPEFVRGIARSDRAFRPGPEFRSAAALYHRVPPDETRR